MDAKNAVVGNTSTTPFVIGQQGQATPQPITIAQAPQPQTPQSEPSIDYDKIASIVDGRVKATEDSVLKGYFKEQGLSGDEMAQAIEMFKKDKASKAPDVDALNAQIAAANERALNAELTLKANSIAAELGVQSAKVPYLLKMADTSKAVKDGAIDKSKLKESLEAVLKDVPELASVETPNTQGGFRIGSDGGNDNKGEEINSQLARAFGVTAK